MQYDDGIDIREFLTSLSSGVTFDPFFSTQDQQLPKGWEQLIQPLRFFWMLVSGSPFKTFFRIRFRLVKGILRSSLIDDGQEIAEPISDLFNRIAETVSRDSAVICMVCGDRGNRRKHEQYWPSLCKMHYIQYANYLHDYGTT